MKKMIDQEKINKSDALFEGMTADENGNVEIGKNLTVDGKVIINTATDLETKDGTSFGGGEEKLVLHINDVLTKEQFDKIRNNEVEVTLIVNNYPFPMPLANKYIDNETEQKLQFFYCYPEPDRKPGNNVSIDWTFYAYEVDITKSNNYKVVAGSYTKSISLGAIKYQSDLVTYQYMNYSSPESKYLFPTAKPANQTSTFIFKYKAGNAVWELEKQYFNHDVQIMFNNSPLFLSIITTSNTPIDSITDLKTACGSRTRIPMSGGFAGTGSVIQFACAYLPQENKLQLYSGNTTTVGGTTVLLATGDGNTLGAITDDITTL